MCLGVFEDGAGCVEFCAAAGMICSEAWENMDGVCAADLSRPELSCSTGHFSDYCVCVDPGDCTPACENKSCGDDGCGGFCGVCDAGASCVSGTCELPYNSSSLFDALVGYGQGTTGGLGGSLCTVTNLNNAGSGSLRACAESSGKKWIQFALSGDLYLNSDIQMKSNKTIDGRNQKIRIFNKGLNISNHSNIIVTNLIFKKGDSSDDNDAIRVRNGSQDVWIHHCSFSNYHDGLVDIKEGSTDITVSWSKFSDHNKVMLIGASVNDTMDEDIRVTLHHNWFKGTEQRHPRLRFGRVHAFNNYYDSWGNYGLGCSYKGQCFSENNVYEAGSNKKAVVHRVGSDSQDGKVRSEGDWRLNWAMIDEKDPSSVFDPAEDYTYNADNADNALIQNIQSHGGWQEDS
jgi:pectate lyase